MKTYLVIALPLALAAMPAQATQGLLCVPASGEGPQLSLVVGAGGVAGASLDEGDGWVSTMASEATLILTQSWIDGEQVLADIADRRWERIARLSARFQPPARRQPMTAVGTLTLRGRDWRVRCQED